MTKIPKLAERAYKVIKENYTYGTIIECLREKGQITDDKIVQAITEGLNDTLEAAKKHAEGDLDSSLQSHNSEIQTYLRNTIAALNKKGGLDAYLSTLDDYKNQY